jgi:hypothetical protein
MAATLDSKIGSIGLAIPENPGYGIKTKSISSTIIRDIDEKLQKMAATLEFKMAATRVGS